MRNKPNIIIKEKGKSEKYIPANSRGGKPKIPTRENRKQHSSFLSKQFDDAWKASFLTDEQKAAIAIKTREGKYLEIKGQKGYDLITKSLEDVRQNVRLLKTDQQDGIQQAVVFVPSHKYDFFLKKLAKYCETESGMDVIATIEEIKVAFVENLWVGKKEEFPDENKKWCEIWLRLRENEDCYKIFEKTKDFCGKLEIDMLDEKIIFLERLVVAVNADKTDLAKLMIATSRFSEVRKLPISVDFFTGLSNSEQKEWIEELLERVEVCDTGVKVCLLDTGVNNSHKLLGALLDDEDCLTVNPIFGTDDRRGHGTGMAGITAYNNLEQILECGHSVKLNHKLESVKIFNSQGDNSVNLYGYVTSQAISIAEINDAEAKRVVCMAVSTEEDATYDGSPSSWSGAIDAITAGVNDNTKRLMMVSAGNVKWEELKELGYPNANRMHLIENPGQAWNAITVGAYTEKDRIFDEKYEEYQILAQAGELSPFSSTSADWIKKWPIKPEVLFEGGNVAITEGDIAYPEDLSLLTTYYKPTLHKQFSTINMTSSATAQAAYMVAEISASYPELWSETVRGLMIHSAEWTHQMRNSF